MTSQSELFSSKSSPSTSLVPAGMNHLPALTAGSMGAYINAAYQIPVLSKEEEQALGRALQQDGDMDAARRLVMAHLRFVVYVARGYNGYGLPLADLIQEGNIGLMKAVKRFDVDKGVRLVSFAVHWIRAEIHEFVLRNWRIVKVATTKAQRKLFFNLRSSKQRLGWFKKEEVEQVARDLGVKPAEVMEMESRLSAHDAAFDGASDGDDDENYRAPVAQLEDHRADPALVVEQSDSKQDYTRRLAEAMGILDARSRDILQRRWMQEPKATLHELAAEYEVSAERIRQLEANAMKKMRGCFEA